MTEPERKAYRKGIYTALAYFGTFGPLWWAFYLLNYAQTGEHVWPALAFCIAVSVFVWWRWVHNGS